MYKLVSTVSQVVTALGVVAVNPDIEVIVYMAQLLKVHIWSSYGSG